MLNVPGNKMKDFTFSVETVVNEDVLGKLDHNGRDLGRWKFPLTDGKLGDVKFSNPTARKFTKNLKAVIDICLANHPETDRSQWFSAAEQFESAMQQLCSHKKFEQKDVCAFQDTADNFCDIYCRMTGIEGMTNYLHCLRAGHFAYFLQCKGSLYRYSQQAWESINGILKRTFHHNTQRGGGSHGSSKLLPVFLSLTRAYLWRTGVLGKFFDNVNNVNTDQLDMQYDKVPKKHYDRNVPQDVIDAYVKTLMWLGCPNDIIGDFEDDLLDNNNLTQFMGELEDLPDDDGMFDEFWHGIEIEAL